MIKIPEFLRQGDCIAICSCARKVSVEEVKTAKELLERRGYRVVLGNTIGLSHNQFAGTDLERAKDVQEMIERKDIKAVFFARGGYGTVRILDLLDFSPLKESPKWFIGYSDITALLFDLYFRSSTASLHAIMPINLTKETINLPCVVSALEVLEGKGVRFESQSGFGQQNVEFSGEAIGGNLSVIYSLLGSNSFLDLTNKVLFIEDLDEYLYHIDRMMQGLKRAGKLKGLKGLIVGTFSQMHDNSVPFGQNAYEIIASAIAEYDYPKVFGADIGHIPQRNFPIMVGKEVNVKQEGSRITIWQE